MSEQLTRLEYFKIEAGRALRRGLTTGFLAGGLINDEIAKAFTSPEAVGAARGASIVFLTMAFIYTGSAIANFFNYLSEKRNS